MDIALLTIFGRALVGEVLGYIDRHGRDAMDASEVERLVQLRVSAVAEASRVEGSAVQGSVESYRVRHAAGAATPEAQAEAAAALIAGERAVTVPAGGGDDPAFRVTSALGGPPLELTGGAANAPAAAAHGPHVGSDEFPDGGVSET